jgi:ATPase family associated with various cellular activities (AAA)
MLTNHQVMNPYVIRLCKTSVISLNDISIQAQMEKIRGRALGSDRKAKGWRLKIEVKLEKPTSPGLPYKYVSILTFTYSPRRQRKPEAIEKEWGHIVEVTTKAGNQPGWFPEEVAGHPASQDANVSKPETVELAEFDIPDDWNNWFKGELYGRDDQLEIIIEVLLEAKLSAFQNRFNIILFGPPGSGKTEIIRILKANLPRDTWLEFDCTNTTAAGAIEELKRREKMPTLVFLEELEKAHKPEDKAWLLAATDTRAEIRKVRYRNSVHRDVHFVCIATVNDIEALEREYTSALESRFPYQIECPHPDEATVRKILERDIARRSTFKKTDFRWINPAIELAKELKVTDPRKIRAWCLTGKDKLLFGEWQKRVKATTRKK